MTPRDLRKRIRKFPAKPSATTRLERDLTANGIKQPNVWYKSQKEHWLGWLGEYDGPGFYNRKKWDRTAEFSYNHINCSPMVLWLGEAAGVTKKTIEEARRAALRAKKKMGSQCAAIRKIIPWSLIEEHLARKSTA
jgi:hypothetical protein